MKSRLNLLVLFLLAFIFSVTLTLTGAEKKLSEPPVPAVPQAAPNIPRLTTQDLRPSYYNAGEFSVDAFASGQFTSLESFGRVEYGGGIGGNWFPFRTAGLGIEARTEDTAHSFFDDVAGKLLARLPWDRFALNFGIGGNFNFERDDWAVFAEAGPEFRFSPTAGLFATVRGVHPIAGHDGEHVLVLAGLRVAFGK